MINRIGDGRIFWGIRIGVFGKLEVDELKPRASSENPEAGSQEIRAIKERLEHAQKDRT